jgi:DNA mismatch endonuclease (patch repair protein)
MDTLSKQKRSELMAKVGKKNTGAEKAVRSLLHSLGFRFRLHRKDLPGTPDIVLPKHNAIVQVHGCFWHRHKGCKRAVTPKSNVEFWTAKFQRNVARDRAVKKRLTALGWKVTIVWECELKNEYKLLKKLNKIASN